MDWFAFLQHTAPIGALIAWAWFRLDKKFGKIDEDIKELKNDLKEIRMSLNFINIKLVQLETRVEERTLRVIHTGNTGTEEKK
jgi:hypothetical protein